MNISSLWLLINFAIFGKAKTDYREDMIKKDIIDTIGRFFEEMHSDLNCITYREDPKGTEKEIMFIELDSDLKSYKIIFTNLEFYDKEIYCNRISDDVKLEDTITRVINDLDVNAKDNKKINAYFCFKDKNSADLTEEERHIVESFIEMFKKQYGFTSTLGYVPISFEHLVQIEDLSLNVMDDTEKVIFREAADDSMVLVDFYDSRISFYNVNDDFSLLYSEIEEILNCDYLNLMNMLEQKSIIQDSSDESSDLKDSNFIFETLKEYDDKRENMLKRASYKIMTDLWKYLQDYKNFTKYFHEIISNQEICELNDLENALKIFVDDYKKIFGKKVRKEILSKKPTTEDYISIINATFLSDKTLQEDNNRFLNIIFKIFQKTIAKLAFNDFELSKYIMKCIGEVKLNYWKKWVPECQKYMKHRMVRELANKDKRETQDFKIIKNRCTERYLSGNNRCKISKLFIKALKEIYNNQN